MKLIRTKILSVIVLLLITALQLVAQHSRYATSINEGWKFHLGGTDYADDPSFNDAAWENISLPHTWNAKDPFDDDETYVRGLGWYRRELKLGKSYQNKKLFLFFEGANQVTELYVNGAFVGRHKGGYTAFSFDITSFVNQGNDENVNSIAVLVSNANDNFIPPLSVGYAIYGGIYRDVWLIATSDIHFKEINNDAGGIQISTENVDSKTPKVRVKTTLLNDSEKNRQFRLLNTIYDGDGTIISSFFKDVSIAAGGESDVDLNSEKINTPQLWSPESPYLYSVKTQIIENGKLLDEVNNKLGFRWFRFDADSGFFLNGKKFVLKGTNRHQDLKGKGSALSAADHLRDIKLIKEMGANFLRLAHYPQAPYVLNLADELGLIIWEEVPLVNYMNIDPEFLSNAENMIHEMIHQHYNHPSIVMWGSMNEILLHSKQGDRIQRQNDSEYVKKVQRYAIKLDSVVRAEDPSRYSTMAIHGSNEYTKYFIDTISQVVGHNLYNGWYGGKAEEFGPTLDKIHSASPRQIMFVSEYGAGSSRQLASSNPQRVDFTSQYQRYYHESYLRQIKSRPYLAGTAIWNQFDFSQPNIGGPIINENNKGMLTWDRQYKDVYFLYKANWNPSPMIYIAERDWTKRAGYANTDFKIDVYSNAVKVKLFVNDSLLSQKNTDDVRKVSFNTKLKNGDNLIEAVATINGKTIKDVLTINYTVYPETFTSNFSSLNINVGSNAQYTDDAGIVWMQDQPYKKGSYGYINGTPSTLNLKYMVKGTDHTPLYYSYLDDVSQYKVDLPDGNYEVSLFLIETEKIRKGERIFDITINGDKKINDLDLFEEFGFCHALKRTFIVEARNGEGMQINFDAKNGKAVLNGLKILRE